MTEQVPSPSTAQVEPNGFSGPSQALVHNHPVHNHPVPPPIPHVHGQYMAPGLGALGQSMASGGSFVLGMLAGAALLYFIQHKRSV